MTTTVGMDAIEQLSSNLIRVSRRIDRQVSVGGLTSTEASVLGSIVACGPLGLSELAKQQAINRTMLSRVLGKLEAADLIVRRSSIADGRAIEVVATHMGVRLRERLIADRTRLLAEKLAGLPIETITTIIDAVPGLAELAAALEPTP